MNLLQRMNARTVHPNRAQVPESAQVDDGCEHCQLKFAGKVMHHFPCGCPCHQYANRPMAKNSRTIGLLCWGLIVIFAVISLLVAAYNQRELRSVPTVRRGCVQVEFSADGKNWTATEDPWRHPLPILRLHNTCSGTAVRLDEPEDRE